MGKVIRGCRRGKGSIFRSHTCGREGAAKLKKLDFAERHGYVKGVVREFRSAYSFKKIENLIPAPEGMYTGQYVFQGKKGKF